MTNYRVHITVIGHSESGKTSFIYRLLGNNKYKDQCESWAGLRRYFVQSTFDSNSLISSKWTESQFNASVFEESFNQNVLRQTENFEDLQRGDKPRSISKFKVDYWKVEPNNDVKTLSDESTTYQKEHEANEKLDEEKVSLSFPESPRNDWNETSQPEEDFTPPPPKVCKMSQDTLKQLVKSKDTFTANSHQPSGIPYSINIWEHGSQGKFISMNNLFMNTNAVVLIMMDITFDIHTPMKGIIEEHRGFGYPKTPAQILCYWLNMLQDHAEKEQTQPNIALVLTHKDMIEAKDHQQYIDNYIDALLKCTMEKTYRSYISKENIFVVDNKTSHEDHLNEIRSRIFKMITKQKKNWGTSQPVRWLKLEADILRKAGENGSPFLSMSVAESLAAQYAMTTSEVKSFLSFHQIFGDWIYYPEPELKDVIIINPQWLWDKFKALITPQEFLDKRKLQLQFLQDWKNGVMSEESLQIVWNNNDIQFLKNIMVKFGLIRELENDCKYFIPCALPLQNVDPYGTKQFQNMSITYSCILWPGHNAAMSGEAFHRLLSECSKISNWKISHLTYTDASLEMNDGTHIAFALTKSNIIRVSVWSHPDKMFGDEIPKILHTHQALCKRAISLGMTQIDGFYVLCPYWNRSDEFQCLVRVNDKGGYIKPKDSRCTIHHKEISASHFPQNSKGKYTS